MLIGDEILMASRHPRQLVFACRETTTLYNPYKHRRPRQGPGLTVGLGAGPAGLPHAPQLFFLRAPRPPAPPLQEKTNKTPLPLTFWLALREPIWRASVIQKVCDSRLIRKGGKHRGQLSAFLVSSPSPTGTHGRRSFENEQREPYWASRFG